MIGKILSLFDKKRSKIQLQHHTQIGFAETELYVDTENDFELVDSLKRVKCSIHGEVVHTKMLFSQIDGSTGEILFCPICYAQFCGITFPVFDLNEED